MVSVTVSVTDSEGNSTVSQTTFSVGSDTLRWSPPVGWESYTEYVIPDSGQSIYINLDPNIDYKLVSPNTLHGRVEIRGGRNIVWIGGHVCIEGFSVPPAQGYHRRGVSISDQGGETEGRIVHLEGLLLDGDDLAEGINTNCPTATVQLQNIRVEEVKIKSADDRDNQSNHADIFQPWGSQAELRMDRFTGRSNYQGFYLREEVSGNRLGDYWFSRVNVEGIETIVDLADDGDGLPYANVRFFRADFLHQIGPWHLDNVWVKCHPDSQYGTALELNVNPAPTEVDTDPIGKYVAWPSVLLADGRDFCDDRLYEGDPPGGDFVLAVDVGLGYVSPGYD